MYLKVSKLDLGAFIRKVRKKLVKKKLDDLTNESYLLNIAIETACFKKGI